MSFSRQRPALPILLALRAGPGVQGGLGGGEAGDRHAVGRAADVVEADSLAEGDGGGVAAVLAADAHLDALARGPAPLGGDADQVADAVLVEADEGIGLEDALLHVG